MKKCIKCGADLPEEALFCHICGKKQVQEKRRGRMRQNGQGNAYRRGSTWTGRAAGYSYTITDKNGDTKLIRKRPTKGGFKTKTAALEWAAAQDVGQARKEPPTLLELWQGWSENDLLTRSKDKQLAYKKARERIEPIIARKISDLTIDDLQSTVNAGAKSYYTARDMKSLLSHLYQRAMVSGGSNGLVTVNLSRFIVLPDLEEKIPEPFTEDEVSAMWKAWDEGNLFVGYMLLMIYTSMMPGELLSCKTDMIDYDRHEIYGCGKKTKKRKDTPIVFPGFIEPILKELSEKSTSKTGKIFGGDEGTFYSAYHSTTSAIGVRDLNPYSCRHTTATEAVKKGVELPVVQQIMRHSKLASTQRYIHVSTEAAHKAINQLTKQ
nr:MAG TPA: Integrase [Caudoviricetes sp.]